MKIINYKNLIRGIFIIVFLFNISPALAVTVNPACGKEFCLNVPIGANVTGFNIDPADKTGGNNILGSYIAAWYGFLLGTIGILATVMIMWGGFKYLTSRGDKGVIKGAQDNIISAITGVVLAFGTYTLLSLINPALLTINMPNLKPLEGGKNIKLANPDNKLDPVLQYDSAAPITNANHNLILGKDFNSFLADFNEAYPNSPVVATNVALIPPDRIPTAPYLPDQLKPIGLSFQIDAANQNLTAYIANSNNKQNNDEFGRRVYAIENFKYTWLDPHSRGNDTDSPVWLGEYSFSPTPHADYPQDYANLPVNDSYWK